MLFLLEGAVQAKGVFRIDAHCLLFNYYQEQLFISVCAKERTGA